MANDFAAIGFPSPREDLDFFNRFFEEHHQLSHSLPVDHGRYVVWQLPSGPELWVTLDAAGEVQELRPHFNGTVRRDVSIIDRLPLDKNNSWEGAFYCYANPAEDDLEDGDYPFIVEVPGFRLYDHLQAPLRSKLSLTGFALELEFHLNADAFTRTQPILGHTPEGIPEVPSAPIKLGAEYFFPTGTMPKPGFDPAAFADFAGEILSAQYLKNPLSERWYWWIRVRTYGGEIDVVADPEIVPTDPAPMKWNVVKGSFWLSGRPYSLDA